MGYGLDNEIVDDELDRLLATLDRRYRAASAAAGAARAEYWALRHDTDTPLDQLEMTQFQWQRLEYRRHEIANQIDHLKSWPSPSGGLWMRRGTGRLCRWPRVSNCLPIILDASCRSGSGCTRRGPCPGTVWPIVPGCSRCA